MKTCVNCQDKNCTNCEILLLVDLTQKICIDCGEPKYKNEFHKHKAAKDGLKNYCKECNKKRVREFKKRNPELKKLWAKNSYLKKKYNINLDEYNILLKNQNGKCAICKKNPKPNKGLAVDHSHITGKIRGLLCYKCNNGLGLFDDNISYLKNAIGYLKYQATLEKPFL